MIPLAILAGGLGTRLHPITLTQPKSLVRVLNVPFIELQLKLLSKSGFERVVLCLGHKHEEIIRYLGDGNRFEMEIEYSIEPTMLGTGGALFHARNKLGPNFGVLYGDSYLPINYRTITEYFFKQNTIALMTLYKRKSFSDECNVKFVNQKVMLYSKREKKTEMLHVDYGFSILNSKVFNYFPNAENAESVDLADIFERISKEGQVSGFEVAERFYEVGSHEGIRELEKFLKEND